MDSGRAHRLGQAVASVLAEQQPTGAAGTAGVAAEPAVAADPAAAEQQPGAAAGPTDSAVGDGARSARSAGTTPGR
ncbi:hypothetical protein OSJ80_10090 [Mycobacterium ulcerans]